MFSKLSLLAVGCTAMQVREPMRKEFSDQFLNAEGMQPNELFIPTGSNPCIFQLGDTFYDFTLFKTYISSPVAYLNL